MTAMRSSFTPIPVVRGVFEAALDGITGRTFIVDARDCSFTLQAISADHLYPAADAVVERGPIVVSRMNDGRFFVHNGRHRVIRALLERSYRLVAKSLYDDDGTVGE